MKRREYIGKFDASEALEKRIAQINEMLLENNVRLYLEDETPYQSEKPHHIADEKKLLIIEFEKKNKNDRNAGRKRLDVTGEHSSLWRVSDVRTSMKDIGIEETAKLLGCSRATLYRRLKELKGKDDWLFY